MQPLTGSNEQVYAHDLSAQHFNSDGDLVSHNGIIPKAEYDSAEIYPDGSIFIDTDGSQQVYNAGVLGTPTPILLKDTPAEIKAGLDDGKLITALNFKAALESNTYTNEGLPYSIAIQGITIGTKPSGGGNCTYFGKDAGNGATGDNLTFTGLNCGKGTTGHHIAANGTHAALNATGHYITASGSFAGADSTQSSELDSFGYKSGYQNSGKELLSLGHKAGQNNSGEFCCIAGSNGGEDNAGERLASFGHQSGYQNTGSWLSAFGVSAGKYNTGHKASFNGTYAGQSNTFNNAGGFGYNAQPTADNELKLGDSNLTSVRSSASIHATAFNVTSDARLKTSVQHINIEKAKAFAKALKWKQYVKSPVLDETRLKEMTSLLNIIKSSSNKKATDSDKKVLENNLNEVKDAYDKVILDQAKSKKLEYGLIAQEVKELCDELDAFRDVVLEDSLGYYSLNYTSIFAIVNAARQA